MASLVPLLEQSEIQRLFFETALGDPQAREQLLERLAQVRIPHRKVSNPLYKTCEDEVRQRFLLKIWHGKVRWDPEKGTLSAYVLSIVCRIWCDMMRELPSGGKKADALPASSLGIDLEGFVDPSLPARGHAEFPSCEDAPRLSEKRRMELSRIPCQERLVVKMWKPYLCGFEFESDEADRLKRRCGIEEGELSSLLKSEWEKAFAAGKDHVSASAIATLLKALRNTIDQTLRRARSHLPWLDSPADDSL